MELAILELLGDDGQPLTLERIAYAIDESPRAVRNGLRLLREHGLVDFVSADGSSGRWQLTDPGREELRGWVDSAR